MRGYSLTELLIALVIFQIGILGVLGMALVGTRELAVAAELQRAAGALETVGDSLLRSGVSPEGSTRRGGWEVRWREISGGLLIEVAPVTARDRVVVSTLLPALR